MLAISGLQYSISSAAYELGDLVRLQEPCLAEGAMDVGAATNARMGRQRTT